MHSKIELPVRSTTRYPAWSMSCATAARCATFIRMPHRLCCPSRRVWSMISISAMEEYSLEPLRVDVVCLEVGVIHDAPMQLDRCVDAVDFECCQRGPPVAHGIVAVGATDD